MLPRKFLPLLILAVSLPVFGQSTQYISDHIPILLRSGPSLQNKIVQSLTAGDEVTVLDSNEDTGYSHVRVVGNGAEGWLLTRFLMSQPSARSQLSSVRSQLDQAQRRANDLQAQVASLKQTVKQTHGKLQTTTANARDVTAKLQDIRRASANAIQLRNENERLKKRVADSQQRINRLAMEKKEVTSQKRQQWFLIGGAVLLGGILIGLIAPYTKRRRRSRW